MHHLQVQIRPVHEVSGPAEASTDGFDDEKRLLETELRQLREIHLTFMLAEDVFVLDVYGGSGTNIQHAPADVAVVILNQFLFYHVFSV